MEIVNITPRGYCYGVVDAMVIARNASLDTSLPRPIYILGMIVHNRHITEAFEEAGIHTVDGQNRDEILNKIDKGTVIFTAHGTSPEIMEKAKAKGLVTIDATCPDVTITHEIIEQKVANGYDVLYIGKKGHPEPEGAIGVAPEYVHLISSIEDAKTIQLGTDKLFVTNQTTMSQWDVGDIIQILQQRFPSIEVHEDICNATQTRQQAVAEQARDCNVTIVVGDPRSNNSNRLAQVSEEIAHTPAYRVADVSEMKPEMLKNAKKVGITAGASTPTRIVKEVIDYLCNFSTEDASTWYQESNVSSEDILPRAKIRDISENRENKLNELRRGVK